MILANLSKPGEPKPTISHCDIDGLSEDTVLSVGEGYNLSVSARNIEHDGIIDLRGSSTHLDMSHAMIHSDDRLLVLQSQCPRY